MNWKFILSKLRPNNLVDLFVDLIIQMMELWAVVRAFIIMLLIVMVIVLYVDQRLIPDYELFLKTIGDFNENTWDSSSN